MFNFMLLFSFPFLLNWIGMKGYWILICKYPKRGRRKEATARLLFGSLKLKCVQGGIFIFLQHFNGLFIGKGSCSGLLDIFGFEILAWRRKSSFILVPLLASATYCHCLVQHANTQWSDCDFVGARARGCCWLSLYTLVAGGFGAGGKGKGTNLDGLKYHGT